MKLQNAITRSRQLVTNQGRKGSQWSKTAVALRKKKKNIPSTSAIMNLVYSEHSLITNQSHSSVTFPLLRFEKLLDVLNSAIMSKHWIFAEICFNIEYNEPSGTLTNFDITFTFCSRHYILQFQWVDILLRFFNFRTMGENTLKRSIFALKVKCEIIHEIQSGKPR